MNLGHIFSVLLLLFSVNIYSMAEQNSALNTQKKQRKFTEEEIVSLQAQVIRCLLLELPDGASRTSDHKGINIQGQLQESHESANSESHTDGKHEEKDE